MSYGDGGIENRESRKLKTNEKRLFHSFFIRPRPVADNGSLT